MGLQLADTEKRRKSGRGKSCHAAIREAGDSPGHKAGRTFLPFIMVWVSGGQSDSEMQMCLLERGVGNHPCKAGKAAGLGRGRRNYNCGGDAVRAQRIPQEPQHWEGSAWLFCTVAKGQSGRGLSREGRGSVDRQLPLLRAAPEEGLCCEPWSRPHSWQLGWEINACRRVWSALHIIPCVRVNPKRIS